MFCFIFFSDSCQLIHNSPLKLNNTNSPCMQIKITTHPILKQYKSLKSSSLSSVEMSPIKQYNVHHQYHHENSNQLLQQHQQQHQYPSQYYPMTTLNKYRNNVNSPNCCMTSTILSPPPSQILETNSSLEQQQQQQPLLSSNETNIKTSTAYFPVTTATATSANNHLSSYTSAIHYNNQPIVKYHTMGFHHHHQHQQQQQQQQSTISNPNNKIMSNNYTHTATIHGKFAIKITTVLFFLMLFMILLSLSKNFSIKKLIFVIKLEI